jgi:hypothetical protein
MDLTRRNFLVSSSAALAARSLSLHASQPAQKEAAPLTARAAWMQDQRYRWGVMTHYLSDWQARDHKLEMSVELWNKLINGFDVEAMARRLHSVGAGHYQISIGQNSGYYLSPNAAYDRIVRNNPSKCSHRDLVADLYGPLSQHDIKLMVYLPSGAPAQDKSAVAALEWTNGPHPNKNFQRKWQQIIEEWSRRWGQKVSGWWFDGCYFSNTMYRSTDAPNFASFAAAARAGYSASCIAFNPGVLYRFLAVTPEEDFTAGEIDKPELVAIRRAEKGQVDGTQLHMLSFLGEKWGSGAPRFTSEQVVAFTGNILNAGGSLTWDVPVELDGTIRDVFLDQLMAVNKAFPREAKA